MKQKQWSKEWLYYRLIFAILILGSLAIVYTYHMVTKTWLRNVNYPFSYAIFQWQFLSFFTYQSNFLVGLWFLIAAIYYRRKNWFVDNQNVRLAITCYITVTSIVWTCFLLPGMFLTGIKFDYFGLVTGVTFHIIFPTSMIIHTLAYKEPLNKTRAQYYRSSFWIYWIYPILYSTFIATGFFLLVRNIIGIPLQIAFPYAPFFSDPGEIGYIGDLLETLYLMIFLFIIVQILFIAINLFYVGLLPGGKKIKKKLNKK